MTIDKRSLRSILKNTILAILFLSITPVFFSQAQLSEEELKTQADELFSDEQYAKAVPLYSQLISNFPGNSEYVYKFGASKLYAEQDKEAPILYLEKALKKGNTDADLYYYLAKAYHLNFRFTDAIKYYKMYQGTGKKRSQIPVEREIEMAKNGQTLLKNIKDIAVKSKKMIDLGDFYKAYNSSDFNGKLLEVPASFLSKKDKSRGHVPIMFTNSTANTIFFSSYGDDGKNGKDLYYITKNDSGEFEEPKNIGATLNTPYDEDFPFLHPNGKKLYFASKGHNSMGGYDIFVSSYDAGIGKWSAPQNVDFAINSPGDDFLYITNEDEDLATFSSTRDAVFGKTNVYTVQTGRIPITNTVLKGKFISEVSKKASITVINSSNGKEEGIFYPDTTTGDYALIIPNGGTYDIIIDVDGSETVHKGTVSVPRQNELVSLGQEINLDIIGNEETLNINNKFEEKKPIDDEDIKAELLKQKQKLDVNFDDVITQIDEEFEEESITESSDESLLEKPENIDKINSIKVLAENKKIQAADLVTKVNTLNLEDKTKESEIKEKLLTEAQKSEAESRELFAIAANAENNPNDVNAFEALNEVQNETKALELNSNYDNVYRTEIAELRDSFKKTKKERDVLQSSIDNIEDDLKTLDQQIESAKKKERPNLEAQKAELQSELEVQKGEMEKISANYFETENKIKETEQKQEEVFAILNGESISSENNDLAEANDSETIEQNIVEETQTEDDFSTNTDEDLTESNNQFNTEQTNEVVEGNELSSSTGTENTDGTNNSNIDSSSTLSEDTENTNPEIANNSIASNETIEYAWEEDIPQQNYNDFFEEQLTNAEGSENDDNAISNEKTALYDAWIENINTDILQKSNSIRGLPDDDVTKEQTIIEIQQLNALKQEKESKRNEIFGSNLITDNSGSLEDELANDNRASTGSDLILSNPDEAIKTYDMKEYIVEEILISSNPEMSDSINMFKRNKSTIKTIDNEKNKVKELRKVNLKEINNLNNLVANLDAKINSNELSEEEILNQNQLRNNLIQLKSLKENKDKAYKKYLVANDIPIENEEEILASNNNSSSAEATQSSLATSNTSINNEDETLASNERLSSNTTAENNVQSENQNAQTTSTKQREELINTFKEEKFLEDKKAILAAQEEELNKDPNNIANDLADINGQIASTKKPSKELLAEKNRLEKESNIIEGKKAGIKSVKDELIAINLKQDFNYFDAPQANQKIKDLIREYKGESLIKKTEITELEEQLAQTKKKADKKLIQDKINKEQAKIAVLEGKINKMEANQALVEEHEKTSIAALLMSDMTSNMSVPLTNKVLDESQISELISSDDFKTFSKTEKRYKEAYVSYLTAKKQGSDGNKELSIMQDAINDNANLLSSNRELAQNIFAFKQNNPEQLALNEKVIDANSAELIIKNDEVDPISLVQLEDPFTNNQNNNQRTATDNSVNIEEINSNETIDNTTALNDNTEEIDPIQSNLTENNQNNSSTNEEFIENNEEQQLQSLQDQLTNNNTSPPSEAVENNNYVENSVDKDKQIVEDVFNTNNSTPDEAGIQSINSNSNRDNVAEFNSRIESTEFTILPNKNSFYTEENPIKINPPMPSGIIYMVQVGAFRKPIPQNTFKGFNPIIGQTTSSGLTKYLAGNFNEFNAADKAKNQIRSLGYPDAFVVAYESGVKTSVRKARNSESNSNLTTNNFTQENTSENNSQGYDETTDKVSLDPIDLSNIEGVIYTVQVGAYSTPPTTGPVVNIKPLYVDVTNNGLNRYTTGKFSTLEQAGFSKDLMVDVGIADAFITAYKNGKRITISQAKSELSDNTEIPSSTKNITEQSKNVKFAVQIGVFSSLIPVSEVDQFIEINASYPVIVNKDERGFYLYYIGFYETRSEAENIEKEINSKFASLNAYVIETIEGKKVK